MKGVALKKGDYSWDRHLSKLAMITPWPPWYSGGIERVIKEITMRLKKDFQIIIYCTNNNEGQYTWKKVPVYAFRGHTKAYRFSPSLYTALRKEKFDVIHVHGFTTFMPFATSLAKKRFIFSPYYHHLGSTLSFRALRKIYDPIAGYYLFKNAKSTICNSYAEKKIILSCLRMPIKIRVIYNGVDIPKIKNSEPYSFAGKLILSVGRLEKYKNVQLIIYAMKYLSKKFTLYIIGKGSYEDKLKKLTYEIGLKDRVKFLGYLPDKEVYRWLKTCSIFLHLSEIESFGMTCIEALVAGKHVIVNDDNFGLRETASLFKERISTINVKKVSPRDLAKLIERKVRQPKTEIDFRKFDWDIIAREFKKTYLENMENP